MYVSYSERFPKFRCTVPKLLIRKRYYVLFLIPVFIVQVTKLVQFSQYNTFSKIPPSTLMHFATRVRTWRVARLYSEIVLSRKPFGIGHMYLYTFLLRMTEWPLRPPGTSCIRLMYRPLWYPWSSYLLRATTRGETHNFVANLSYHEVSFVAEVGRLPM
jgi:hypothetical protein